MDYGKTLNLPKTDFPMRGNLPQREPEILKWWEEIDIYGQVQKKNKGKPKFILHDGPPYANGHIHLGHTLNKVLKDIIVKFHSMSGYDAPYVPGWDTHGLPIEQQVIKNLKINRHELDPVEFRKKCKEYALKFAGIQKEEFKRLGVRGDWDNPYYTLLPKYEAKQIRVFGEMAKAGYIYKGLKPVYWCADCETALAEAEVEYGEKTSPSIYVKFPVSDGKGLLPEDNTYVVIWTTTPWTLPGNVAITLHPELDYVLAQIGEEKHLLAQELLENYIETAGLEGAQVLEKFKGEQLEKVVCRHPFMERHSLVILGDHVTTETGTGCVHTAPGHGEEDFQVGKKYNLPVVSPVDSRGIFTAEAGKFEGMKIWEANKAVIEELQEQGKLVHVDKIQHSYPHCWRCKNPVFFRATEQWFASVEGFRKKALEAIRSRVKWIPSWGEDRIYNMIEGRGDWCISRQRVWGVPIPIFYCKECGKELINEETISHLEKIFAEEGSDAWFSKKVKELLPEGIKCENCGAAEFDKEKDIMDVWFDSGSSHMGVLQQPELWPDLRWPADLYLEGSDQHRGWFNSSLSTAIAVTGEPPYKAVLTHGFVVDEKGRKMSKSLGNVVDPLKVIKQMGADILRLWVSSADYRADLAVSNNIIKQLTEAYRKIRNTARFLLGNLKDFDPEKHSLPYNDLLELDRWALLRLQRLIDRVLKAYKNYEFHVVYHAVHNFCVVDMSARYLDIIKDRLYTSLPESRERRAAQTVLYEVLDALVRLLAPVLAFTSEEIYRHMPKPEDSPISVQLLDMPQLKDEYIDVDLEQKWDRLMLVRAEVLKYLEKARKEKFIGNSLEAAVQVYADDELYNFLKSMEDQLAEIFITSQAYLNKGIPEGESVSETVPGLAVKVEKAVGKKCERCWMYNEEVGKNSKHPAICPRCAAVMEQLEK
ncbi:MAG: isoleucine--tRNA ligase [Desulfotomaculum sp.]|nr:isoleucine--tRNA ligase [Desulfotomaculum sp.]